MMETRDQRSRNAGQTALLDLRSLISDLWHGGVAQLGEHLLCKQGVVGSSPITSTSLTSTSLTSTSLTSTSLTSTSRRGSRKWLSLGRSPVGGAGAWLMANCKEASCVTVAGDRARAARLVWGIPQCLLREEIAARMAE
jgi:hypothetical protein